MDVLLLCQCPLMATHGTETKLVRKTEGQCESLHEPQPLGPQVGDRLEEWASLPSTDIQKGLPLPL